MDSNAFTPRTKVCIREHACPPDTTLKKVFNNILLIRHSFGSPNRPLAPKIGMSPNVKHLRD